VETVHVGELVRVISRHAALGIAVLAFFLGLGVAASVVPQKTYKANSVVQALPVSTGTGTGAGTDTQLAQFVIPGVVEEVSSTTFSQQVAVKVLAGTADATLSATNDPGTGIIRISATSHSADAAQRWASEAAKLLVAGTTVSKGTLDISLTQDASTPAKPESPQPTPILVAAGMLGVIFAIGASLGAESIRQARNVPSELRARVGIPVLGEVPRVAGLRRPATPIDRVLAAGSPAVVEAFQSIRTGLEIRLRDEPLGSIVVVSPTAGEGRTLIAAVIAWSLASAGRDVVAVDADLRGADLHARLGAQRREGLAEWDRYYASSSLLQPTALRQLSFLAGGVPHRHPADIITAALPQVLKYCQSAGALVVLDSPPLQGVAETPLLLSEAAAAVVVLDVRRRSVDELEAAVLRIREHAEVVGIVLNRVRRRRGATQPLLVRQPALPPATADGSETPRPTLSRANG